MIAEAQHVATLPMDELQALRGGLKKAGKLVRQFTLQSLGAKTLLDMDARIASKAKESLAVTRAEKLLARVKEQDLVNLSQDVGKEVELLARIKAARHEVQQLGDVRDCVDVGLVCAEVDRELNAAIHRVSMRDATTWDAEVGGAITPLLGSSVAEPNLSEVVQGFRDDLAAVMAL